jgi:hypothetical protein
MTSFVRRGDRGLDAIGRACQNGPSLERKHPVNRSDNVVPFRADRGVRATGYEALDCPIHAGVKVDPRDGTVVPTLSGRVGGTVSRRCVLRTRHSSLDLLRMAATRAGVAVASELVTPL